MEGTFRGSLLLLYVVVLNAIIVAGYENQYRLDYVASQLRLKCSSADSEKVLKINKQMTIYLADKETTVYYFENDQAYDHTLSITLTPCSSRIKWALLYDPYIDGDKWNETDVGGSRGRENVGEGEDAGTRTIVTPKARRGCYCLVLTSSDGPMKLNVYLTMDDGGPYELILRQNSNLTLTPLKKQRLRINWSRSSVNPHNTSYCVVLSRKNFPALCSAEEEGPRVLKVEDDKDINMNLMDKMSVEERRNATGMRRRAGKNPLIICVKQKLKVTLAKMKKKEMYFVSLFAINLDTNFTVPYGSSSFVYNFRTKPINLHDGKRRTVYMKKAGGEAYFKYNSPAYKKVKEINFYVLSCGGTVHAEFIRKDRSARIVDWNAVNTTAVNGYKRFTFHTIGDYFLKVFVPDVDEKFRVEYIEVLAATRPSKFPMPAIPDDLDLYEYKSRRTCRSITIGWIPEVDNTKNKYCVTVRENKRVDFADKFRASYQCYLNSENKKGFSSFPPELERKVYVYRKCKEQATVHRRSITNHTITKLKPGRSYTIQVTVQKKNGRTLSYKLLKAVTKQSC